MPAEVCDPGMPVDADVLPQTINDTAGESLCIPQRTEGIENPDHGLPPALSSAPGGQLETFCLDFVTLYELPYLGLGLDSAASGDGEKGRGGGKPHSPPRTEITVALNIAQATVYTVLTRQMGSV